MNRNSKRKNATARRAFTLIELLVVIAIIAILAAILFPVFAQAKLAAKKTVALANAKQISLASQMYQNDNDDALLKSYYGFPSEPTCDWGSVSGDYYNWRWALNPYLAKSTGIISDPTNPFQDNAYWTFANGGGGQPNSYLPSVWAVNTALIGFANGGCAFGNDNKNGLSSLSSVQDVAGTILMTPSRVQWNDLPWDWGTYYGALGGPTVGNPYNGWCEVTNMGTGSTVCPAAGNGPIHAVGKQVTFVWADGHAKSRAYNATLRLNDANYDDWAAYLQVNDKTGKTTTQADRIAAANAGFFPEYQ
jgi:prepilin-type N-terminal cleavage/methylation domain-containing protein